MEDDAYGTNETSSQMFSSQSIKLFESPNKHYNTQTINNQKLNSSFSFCQKKPSQLEVDRLVVYKKGKIIKNEYYVVELSYNQRGFFVSLFSIADESKNMVLEIENQEKTKQILDAFNHNYDELANHIQIIRGQIKIRRPQQLSTQESKGGDGCDKRRNKLPRNIKIGSSQYEDQYQSRNKANSEFGVRMRRNLSTNEKNDNSYQNVNSNKSVDLMKNSRIMNNSKIRSTHSMFNNLIKSKHSRKSPWNQSNFDRDRLSIQSFYEDTSPSINLEKLNQPHPKHPLVPPLSLTQLKNQQIKLNQPIKNNVNNKLTAKTQEENYELLGNTFSNFTQTQLNLTQYNVGGTAPNQPPKQISNAQNETQPSQDNLGTTPTNIDYTTMRDRKISKEIQELIMEDNDDQESFQVVRKSQDNLDQKEVDIQDQKNNEDEEQYENEEFIDEEHDVNNQGDRCEDNTAKFKQEEQSEVRTKVVENDQILINKVDEQSNLSNDDEYEYQEDQFESDIQSQIECNDQVKNEELTIDDQKDQVEIKSEIDIEM